MGHLSEPATVDVTVENVVSEIVELQLSDTLVEGFCLVSKDKDWHLKRD